MSTGYTMKAWQMSQAFFPGKKKAQASTAYASNIDPLTAGFGAKFLAEKSPETRQKLYKSMSNFVENQQKSWLHREKKDRLPERIKNIQRVNAPSTFADEILMGSKVLIVLLLTFSGLLGGMSYFKNFAISMPVEVAIFLALTLTFVIEWGKNKASTWIIRIPFFQGLRWMILTPSNSFICLTLILVSVATFWMSIYNSTKGGEQLAMMLSHEKNHIDFQPNTEEIDSQLAQLQQGISNAPMVKWKGKMYYQDAKSVRAASKSVESLQRQREEIVKMQRQDYERTITVQASQSNFAAKLVLASGGWIELLQVLLIILRVSCEKKLDEICSASPTPAFPGSNEPTYKSPGYTPSPASTHASERPGIGFRWDGYGNATTNTVSQSPPSVSQHIEDFTVLGCDSVLKECERKIRADIPNFKRKDSLPSSVSARINAAFDDCYAIMAKPGFKPTRPVGSSFYQYLVETAIPTLNEKGWPYERDTQFLHKLLSVIPQPSNQ